MKLWFGTYFFSFLATLSCHAQPDSDMYALFSSRRFSGAGSSIEVSASSKSPLFGNIEEELKKARALQIELNAVREALNLAHSNKNSRRVESVPKGTLRGTNEEVTADLEATVDSPRGLKYAKYRYYANDYYSSKSKSHKSYDYYGSKPYKSKSVKKYKDSKKYKSYKSYKVSEELEKCRAELAKHENEVMYLAIQTASSCQVQRSTDGDGEPSYKLVTDSISEDTYVFSDRPYRIEDTVSTADYSAAWSDIF